MSSQSRLSEEDSGKDVVASLGGTVGQIAQVRGGTAYVAPDPSITEATLSKLGWVYDPRMDTYRLETESVETITNEEVRLRY
jgi:hypothetical protein